MWFVVISYLIGSIPYSWLAVYYFAPRNEDGSRVDLRYEGSGNVGASNAIHLLGLKWYLPLIWADASKGYLAINITRYFDFSPSLIFWIGIMAVLGHCFPAYLSLKRGKGISTTIGVLYALNLIPELEIFVGIMILGFLITRIPCVGSLTGLLLIIPTAFYMQRSPADLTMIIIIVVLVFTRHFDNIRGLIAGDEPRTVGI